MSVQLDLPKVTQQSVAKQKIREWFYKDKSQVFSLFGYAGTGKTTTAGILVQQDLKLEMGTEVLFAAYTGKAASVLRSKKLEGASTIHSLIYKPTPKLDADGNVILQNGRPIIVWRRRSPFDSPLSAAKLLVVDEVSMVDEKMATDLMGFGTKMLVMGDPMQLPPIEGTGYFMDSCDYMLTEVHRTAKTESGSAVLRVATAVRESKPGDICLGVDGADYISGRFDDITSDQLLDFDQVLAGQNRTRWFVLQKLRKLRGLTDPMPMVGDRIMTLANSAELEVFNGQQFEVIGVKERNSQTITLEVLDDDKKVRTLTMWTWGFLNRKGEEKAKEKGRGAIAAATFSQVITVHKAQGSEWQKVLVLDEARDYGLINYSKNAGDYGSEVASNMYYEDAKRWLYTAVTRAISQAVIIPITGLPQ